MYVCVCKDIKESDVESLGRAGVTCPNKLAATLGLDDEDNCCGRCLDNIANLATIAARACDRHCISVQV